MEKKANSDELSSKEKYQAERLANIIWGDIKSDGRSMDRMMYLFGGVPREMIPCNYGRGDNSANCMEKYHFVHIVVQIFDDIKNGHLVLKESYE